MVSRLIKTYQSTEEEIVIMTKLRKKSNPGKVISGISHCFIFSFPPSTHTSHSILTIVGVSTLNKISGTGRFSQTRFL